MAIQTTTHHSANAATPARATYEKWIFLAGSASAFAAGLAFLAGLVALRMPGAAPVYTLLRSNWLLTIFRLLAGEPGVQLSQLYRLNALDLVLMSLIAATQAGLYLALQRNRRVLALIALVQPPLGILLLVLTHNAGRSAALGAELVICVAMLGSRVFGKWTAWLGLLSSILLLAGDLGTGLAPNTVLALATVVGYILLAGWLFLVSGRLFQLRRSSAG